MEEIFLLFIQYMPLFIANVSKNCIFEMERNIIDNKEIYDNCDTVILTNINEWKELRDGRSSPLRR